MVDLEKLGDVVSTDLLIIGGGVGGLAAALQAKEKLSSLDVLIVEKQTAGWSGKAQKVGGGLWLLAPEDDVDKFVEYHVRNIGCYLNDQDLLYSWAQEAYGAIEQFGRWGVPVARDADGKLQTVSHPLGLWSGTGGDQNIRPMWESACKMGVKIINKTHIVDLLKQGDRVAGAVGFNLIDGRFYVFKAKAIILANGSCNYRVRRLWSSGCGDGIAAAYRAGAEMRNAEFGSFMDMSRKDGTSFADRNYLFNTLGENMAKKYESEPQSDISIELIMGIEKEVMEGRGPIVFDPSLMPLRNKLETPKQGEFMGAWPMPTQLRRWPLVMSKAAGYQKSSSQKPEAIVVLNGESSPTRVDHDMKTTLRGLWAIGDVSYMGSALTGAVPAPPGRMRGSGVGNALITALRAGKSAAAYASEMAASEIDNQEAARLKDEIFAPIHRDKGFDPAEAIIAIQDVICPVKYNLRKNKERLEEALRTIEGVKERLGDLWAKDTHYLGKCHEVKSYTLSAEMTFRASLMRTESRGWHFREDYPERDDKNWLKWVIIRKEEEKMVVTTEPIPIGKYKYKP